MFCILPKKIDPRKKKSKTNERRIIAESDSEVRRPVENIVASLCASKTSLSYRIPPRTSKYLRSTRFTLNRTKRAALSNKRIFVVSYTKFDRRVSLLPLQKKNPRYGVVVVYSANSCSARKHSRFFVSFLTVTDIFVIGFFFC